MTYIREEIPGKIQAKHGFAKYIESLFIEENFRQWKWLLYGLYHPLSCILILFG